MPRSSSTDRSALLEGARQILPLALGVVPLGLVYGVAVAESQMENWAGGLASTLILAGASQFAIVELIGRDAPWTVIIGTALIINARFVMYSGALAPSFADYPSRWRFPLAYLMTDQVAVTSMLYNDGQADPRRRMSFYLGAGVTFAICWAAGTWIGILLGADVPESLQLGFALPLTFIALLLPSIRNRAGLVAAIVGGLVTLLARNAPFNTNLLVGAASGILAGLLVKR